MLEAIHQKNPLKKKQYDKDLIELVEMMKQKSPKADLINQIVE